MNIHFQFQNRDLRNKILYMRTEYNTPWSEIFRYHLTFHSPSCLCRVWIFSQMEWTTNDGEDTWWEHSPCGVAYSALLLKGEWECEWVVSEWLIDCLIEWVSERERERVSEWVREWASEWVSEWVSDWVTEWVREWVSERVSVWVSEWVSEWVREWVSEWESDWVYKWERKWMDDVGERY